MRCVVRQYQVPDDDAGVAALSAAANPEPWTVADIEEWRRTFPSGGLEHDVVAVDGTTIVGHAQAYRYPWTPPGQFAVGVLVHPRARNRGAGRSLFAEVMEFTQRHQASRLTAVVRADDDAAVRFASSLGFAIERHECEPRLDLTTWQGGAFDDESAALAATGVRFFTYAEAPCEAELYELAKLNARDIPGFDAAAGYPPLPEWRKRWLEDADSPLDCIVLAAVGERLVGVTRIGRYNDAGAMKTWHTSVLREHRGKGIAVALKLLSIRAALRYGAPALLTNNDSRNAGMLRVNAKLGFETTPGVYHLQRPA